jgi:very-short-patch-repair endonuclease
MLLNCEDIKIKSRFDTNIGGNRKPQTYRNCMICGKQFGPLDRLSQIACSKECGYKLRSKRGNPKKGRHYPHLRRAREEQCPICGKVFRGIWNSIRRIQRYCSHDCYMKSRLETMPERRMRELLESLGVKFNQEYRIGRFYIDFYLPDRKLAIEIDGDYWHAKPEVKARDMRKEAFLNNKGIGVVRVRESEKPQVIIERWEQFTGNKAVKL